MEETKIPVYEVVKKLIGEIEPVGSSHIDEKRYKNLQEFTDLIDKMIYDLRQVAYYRGKHEYSMKKAGDHAYNFMHDTGIYE